jgi:hypothetical protein
MAPELIYGLGAVLLLAALFWGMTTYRRSRAARQAGDEETRELYRRKDE